MKKALISLCLMLSVIAVNAQPGRFRPRNIDEEDRIQELLSRLQLTSDAETKFIAEYTAFQKEISEVSKNARPPRGIVDEDEIEKAILHNFDVSEQIIQIRKKYYSRFRTFMKPSQIQMVYRSEKMAGRRHFDPDGPRNPEGRPIPPHE